MTNGEYLEFLNAVDPSGANSFSLWNLGMTDNPNGGILFSAGAANGSKYSLKAGYDRRPVISVDFFDVMRFANWLNNGQGGGDTESVTYTVSIGGLAPRNPGAQFWIPSEDEWHKAAYYQPAATGGDADGYWLYPTRSNQTPASADPNATNPNSANYARGFTTDVGAYPLALSYYGTRDQGGNVWEWNEAIGPGPSRGFRGGAWSTAEIAMRESFHLGNGPTYSNSDVGFRIASAVPEPSAGLSAALGLVLTICRRRTQCGEASL